MPIINTPEHPFVRATLAERNRRVTEVYRLRLDGYSRRDIIRYAIDNWGVKERQVKNYLRKAVAIEIEDGQKIREYAREKALLRLEALYKQATIKGLDKNAWLQRALINDMADISGARVNKHEVSGPEGKPIEIGVKEVEKILKDLDKSDPVPN
jgi:hypothetical protein